MAARERARRAIRGRVGSFCGGVVAVCLMISSQAWASDADLTLPPSEGPVKIGIGFVLLDIVYVDTEKQTAEVEGVLTLSWRDARQAFDAVELGTEERIYQGATQFNEVFEGWWPQAILANESGRYSIQGVLLRIRPDGSLFLTQEVSAVAELPMNLRRYPFDRQDCQLIFEILGFHAGEVELVPANERTAAEAHGISVAEWDLVGLRIENTRYRVASVAGGEVSAAVVTAEIGRRPGHTLRVVMFPLAMLIALSWSVFWMNRESLGNRMDISFVGILTVVAYQIVISDELPSISYFTLLGAFLYICFASMAASVVVNLAVGRLDNRGLDKQGERVDRACQVVFPVGFVGLNLLSAAAFFLFS